MTISEPGEKPSLRFQSAGSIGLAATLRGIAVRSNAIRRPVGVERSGFVKKSLGNGSMHAVYHPASQFWALQGIETALFAGTGLGLLAFAAWWTRTRTG